MFLQTHDGCGQLRRSLITVAAVGRQTVFSTKTPSVQLSYRREGTGESISAWLRLAEVNEVLDEGHVIKHDGRRFHPPPRGNHQLTVLYAVAAGLKLTVIIMHRTKAAKVNLNVTGHR